MPQIQKHKILGLLVLTALLMALLVISLPTLQMKPGEIISLQPSDQISSPSQTPEDVNWLFVILQGFLILLIILTPIHILISLFTKEGRKRLLIDLLRILLIFLVVAALSKSGLLFESSSESSMLQPGFLEQPEFTGEYVTPPNFEASLQPWMLPLLIIGTAAIGAAIAFFVFKFLARQKPAERAPFQDIANNAQAALEALEEAQSDFEDVIVRCYAEMSQTLMIENGIQRDQAMTTHEFEQELMARGFPAQPVQQLTQLFEKVRYGHQKTGANEKLTATQSLNEIIEFCREWS